MTYFHDLISGSGSLEVKEIVQRRRGRREKKREKREEEKRREEKSSVFDVSLSGRKVEVK